MEVETKQQLEAKQSTKLMGERALVNHLRPNHATQQVVQVDILKFCIYLDVLLIVIDCLGEIIRLHFVCNYVNSELRVGCLGRMGKL